MTKQAENRPKPLGATAVRKIKPGHLIMIWWLDAPTETAIVTDVWKYRKGVDALTRVKNGKLELHFVDNSQIIRDLGPVEWNGLWRALPVAAQDAARESIGDLAK